MDLNPYKNVAIASLLTLSVLAITSAYIESKRADQVEVLARNPRVERREATRTHKTGKGGAQRIVERFGPLVAGCTQPAVVEIITTIEPMVWEETVEETAKEQTSPARVGEIFKERPKVALEALAGYNGRLERPFSVSVLCGVDAWRFNPRVGVGYDGRGIYPTAGVSLRF